MNLVEVNMVPRVGVEPTLLSEHDFESCASASSATSAYIRSGAFDEANFGIQLY